MVVSPWNRMDAFPAPPADSDYGWWEKGQPRRASRAELEELCKGEKPMLLWTPESGGTVVDREVDFLRPVVMERDRAAASNGLDWAKVSFFVWSGLLALQVHDLELSRWSGPLLMWIALGVLPLARAWRMHRLLRGEPGTFSPEDREATRFAFWMHAKSWRDTWCTHLLVIVIAAFGLPLFITDTGPLFERAGLDKAAFWAGEWWRLWTGPWLHANVLHLFFNAVALHSFGRQVEAVFGAGWLLLVLWVAMLAGSLASACWLDASSVGFSGAILGVLGFQVGVVFRRPEMLPPGVLKASLATLALVAVIGGVGMQIIDNAAHFGGAAAGALLGWASAKQKPLWRPGRMVGATAGVCLGGSVGWALWALWALIGQ